MNKTSRDVIERIKRVCGTNMHNFKYEENSLEDCFSTVLHAYYFVRPGKETKKFMKKLAKCTINGIKAGMKIADATGELMEGCVAICIIPRIMKLCIRSFDEKWFEYQINRMDNEDFSESIMDKYVQKYDAEQMSHFFQLVAHIGYKNNNFMSEHNCRMLWEEINKECQTIDNSLPIISSDYNDFPMFIFDCLDKDVISKLLFKYIEKDKDICGYVARLIYYFEPLVALEYIGVAMSYADLFGFRVFD